MAFPRDLWSRSTLRQMRRLLVLVGVLTLVGCGEVRISADNSAQNGVITISQAASYDWDRHVGCPSPPASPTLRLRSDAKIEEFLPTETGSVFLTAGNWTGVVGYGGTGGFTPTTCKWSLTLTSAGSGTGTDVWSVVAALATLLLAFATFGVVLLNRQLVQATTQEASETTKMVSEVRTDRELSVRPLIVLSTEDARTEGVSSVNIVVKNIGRGAAVSLVVWLKAGNQIYRSPLQGESHPAKSAVRPRMPAVYLSPGEEFTIPGLPTLRSIGGVGSPADPGDEIVGAEPTNNLVAYCDDVLGNRLRFNLRTNEPPEVRQRDQHPGAWERAWGR
jgi:hypothetical protein